MHLGQISFCDRIAYNIKSSDTKDNILEELLRRFHLQILQRHWNRLDEEGVSHLYRSPHFACLRSNGNPYYMYFTYYEDVPIIYYIDKKIQPGYQKPRMILGRGKWDPVLFQGTVLDGEMVKNTNGKWVFLINDMIAWKGEHLQGQFLPIRLEKIHDMLINYFVPDETMDMCYYRIKQYAHCTQNGIQHLLELKDKLPYTSRGIYFWPFSSKYKPKLYNFDDSLVKAVVRKVKDNPEFREAIVSDHIENVQNNQTTITPKEAAVIKEVQKDIQTMESKPVMDAHEGDIKTLWLRKTEDPDVYDVYTTNNGMVQNTKVGIAHVPTLRVSKMLRAEFKDTTVAMYIPFSCKYEEKFEKWIPQNKIV